jgi:ubiquinone/menaquinone biosynthesis C-methylase UbiE
MVSLPRFGGSLLSPPESDAAAHVATSTLTHNSPMHTAERHGTSTLSFEATPCAICGPGTPAIELYPANFGVDDITPARFSARRLPDRVHYRMVRCSNCGLVRSDPVLDEATLTHLYAESTFDYEAETANLKATYGRYLAKLRAFSNRQDSLLEIGCGDGFFLEQALTQGYSKVRGVEPSEAAIRDASPTVRDQIVCDVMQPGLFAGGGFDAVCLFQVFDHVPHPDAVLESCRAALRPGGLILCLNHNVESVSAHIMKERSPIIDIEHTYLYGPATMRRIFEAGGFKVLKQGHVSNTYSVGYITHLVPMPARVKGMALGALTRTRVGRLTVPVPLGNLYLIASRS